MVISMYVSTCCIQGRETRTQETNINEHKNSANKERERAEVGPHRTTSRAISEVKHAGGALGGH